MFSKEIISNVEETWELINSDITEVGVIFFLRFFQKYPDYQNYFGSFKDVPVSELRKNEGFLKHATSVATALNKSIKHLNDHSTLQELLRKVGEAHVPRKITAQQFRNAQDVLLETIEAALSEKCTPIVKSAWNEVLTAVVASIVEGTKPEEAPECCR